MSSTGLMLMRRSGGRRQLESSRVAFNWAKEVHRRFPPGRRAARGLPGAFLALLSPPSPLLCPYMSSAPAEYGESGVDCPGVKAEVDVLRKLRPMAFQPAS